MEYKKEDLNKLESIEDDYINNSLPDDNCDEFNEILSGDDLELLTIFTPTELETCNLSSFLNQSTD